MSIILEFDTVGHTVTISEYHVDGLTVMAEDFTRVRFRITGTERKELITALIIGCGNPTLAARVEAEL